MIRTSEKLNINNMNHPFNVNHNSEKNIIFTNTFWRYPKNNPNTFQKNLIRFELIMKSFSAKNLPICPLYGCRYST